MSSNGNCTVQENIMNVFGPKQVFMDSFKTRQGECCSWKMCFVVFGIPCLCLKKISSYNSFLFINDKKS